MAKAFSSTKFQYGRTDRLDFGKHNGAFVDDVLSDDPEYIAWMATQAKKPVTQEVLLELVVALMDIISDLRPKKSPFKTVPGEYYKERRPSYGIYDGGLRGDMAHFHAEQEASAIDRDDDYFDDIPF